MAAGFHVPDQAAHSVRAARHKIDLCQFLIIRNPARTKPYGGKVGLFCLVMVSAAFVGPGKICQGDQKCVKIFIIFG